MQRGQMHRRPRSQNATRDYRVSQFASIHRIAAMSDYPRPDLSSILPQPLLRSIAARGLPLAESLRAPQPQPREDFLVEIERKQPLGAEDAGFGISQALAVAGRLRQVLRQPPPASPPNKPPEPMHRPDAERVQQRLFDA